MRRLLSILLVSLLVFSSCQPAFAAATELDYMEYSSDANAQAAYVTNATPVNTITQQQATRDTEYGFLPGGFIGFGQGFKVTTSEDITQISVKLSGLNSPDGTFTLYIYSDNSGTPNTAVATFSNIAENTLPTNPSTTEYTFTGSFTPTIGTQYHIVGKRSGYTQGYVYIEVNTAAGYSDGIFQRVDASNNWTAYSTVDAYFKLYQAIKPLQSYSESTIKTQGSYALKAVAATTDSLNKTLTYTFASPKDLSNKSIWKFDERASRTGANIKVGIHDVGGTTTEITPSIITGDVFQTVITDISQVTNANKDAIDKIIITPTNADEANTVYLDNMFGDSSGQLIMVE